MLRVPLLNGEAGLRQTIGIVDELIHQGGKDPIVRSLATRIVSHVSPGDWTGEIQAIFDWAASLDAPPYRLDPVDDELVRGALDAIGSNGLDCDDWDVLCGSLLMSIGHVVRAVTADGHVGKPGPPRHHHTYLEVWDRAQRKWRAFDPVLRLKFRNAQFGSEMKFKDRTVWQRSGSGAGMYAASNSAALLGAMPDYDRMEDMESGLGKGPFDWLSAFDPTSPKAPIGQLIRATVQTVAPQVITAADAIAKARQDTIKTTGKDPAKVLSDIAAPAFAKKPAPVAIARPVSTITFQPPAPPPAPLPPPSSFGPVGKTSSGLSTGAKVGIGVGAAALLLGGGYLVYKAAA